MKGIRKTTTLQDLFKQISDEYNKLPDTGKKICLICGYSGFGLGGYELEQNKQKRFYCFHCRHLIPEKDAHLIDIIVSKQLERMEKKEKEYNETMRKQKP